MVYFMYMSVHVTSVPSGSHLQGGIQCEGCPGPVAGYVLRPPPLLRPRLSPYSSTAGGAGRRAAGPDHHGVSHQLPNGTLAK